jgi:hypothetical protein
VIWGLLNNYDFYFIFICAMFLISKFWIEIFFGVYFPNLEKVSLQLSIFLLRLLWEL